MLPTVSTLLGDDCEKYPIEICKGAWAIMINGFLRGGSCATWELIETMLSWVNSKGKILVDFDKGNPNHKIFVFVQLDFCCLKFPTQYCRCVYQFVTFLTSQCIKIKISQVNLCQKHLFLIQNMTKDCSLIYNFST